MEPPPLQLQHVPRPGANGHTRSTSSPPPPRLSQSPTPRQSQPRPTTAPNQNPNPRKRPRELTARFPPLNKRSTALLCTCTTEHANGPPKATYFIPAARTTEAPITAVPPHADAPSLQAAISALPVEHCRDVLLGMPDKQLQLLALKAAFLDEGIAAQLLERHTSLFAPARAEVVRFDKIVEHIKAMITSLTALYHNDHMTMGDPLPQSLRQMLFLNISSIHSYAMPGASWRTRTNVLATLLDLARWMADWLKDVSALHPGLLHKSPLGQAFFDICRSMTPEERACVMSSMFDDTLFSTSIERFVQQHAGSGVFLEIAEALVLLRESDQSGHVVRPEGWPRPGASTEAPMTMIDSTGDSSASKKGRQTGSKQKLIASFDKELERFEHSYYERHSGKGYPEQVTAGINLSRQIMNTTRKAAARATPETPWQTRANMLQFMCSIVEMVTGGNGLPLGSSVRQEFFTMSKEFVRIFRDIVGNMTDTEKQMLRIWRPPVSNSNSTDATGRSFEESLERIAEEAEEVLLFYDLRKCLELLRGNHPLFFRCEESWCVSNIFKKQRSV